AVTTTLTPPATEAKQSEEKLGRNWIRLDKDKNGQTIGMQTAIVHYVPVKPAVSENATQPGPAISVDLVAAVHVADAGYYEQLNRRFEKYDAVLYELVAPEGTVVPRGRGTSNANPLGAMQNGMKEILDLDHQLEKIDYTKKNFIHADMSPDQFMQSMKDRDESFLTMYMKLMGEALAQQSGMAAKGESPDLDLIAAFFSDDRPRRLKILFAKQLADVEGLLAGFGGEEGSVLITERNKAALKVLKEQLASGKTHLAIFYGGGHLVDMDARLRKDFNLQPSDITWLTAWDLRPKH
ncbi:MAG TPA: hypothetical protein VGM76_11905, partial [Lacipirellulaceae bacterium]